MSDKKYYICERCGNLVEKIHSSGVSMVCCGQKMTELVPGVVDASHEKHIPVVNIEGDKVTITVGSVVHPMSEEHSILWVSLETDKGMHRVNLSAGDAPTASLVVPGEKPVAVYAYCNLHGLWKTEI